MPRHGHERIYENHRDSYSHDNLYGQHRDAWDVLLLRDVHIQRRGERAKQSCFRGDTSGRADCRGDGESKLEIDVSRTDPGLGRPISRLAGGAGSSALTLAIDAFPKTLIGTLAFPRPFTSHHSLVLRAGQSLFSSRSFFDFRGDFGFYLIVGRQTGLDFGILRRFRGACRLEVE